MQERPVQFLGWEDLLEKGSAGVGYPCGSAGKESTSNNKKLFKKDKKKKKKESACNSGDLGLIPMLGRSPREWE